MLKLRLYFSIMFPYVFLLLCIPFAGGMESGIIGGKVAELNSRPYMASIQINKHHTCGGMLIREDYVLTAAHCLNKFVKVMPLFKNGKTPANVHCSIVGWGLKTPKGNQASDVMREVRLKLEENSKCEKMWQLYFNSERMICSVSDGKHAFCMGDSGSPLICNTKPQGIASYTFNGNCTNKSYPQVYVKISYFLPWIKKKMKMNELN
uniref:trypsin n=1 Tax=Sinocyclocheilus rhinocerous TaxID=307959 RepID=A0A673GX78_9TELE